MLIPILTTLFTAFKCRKKPIRIFWYLVPVVLTSLTILATFFDRNAVLPIRPFSIGIGYLATREESWTDLYGYHKADCYVVDSNGQRFNIDCKEYNRLKNLWQNEKITPGPRYGQISVGDGMISSTNWDNKDSTILICSGGQPPHPRKQEKIYSKGLFEYPPITDFYQQKSLLGLNDPKVDRQLSVGLARMGYEKNARMFILVFNDKPIDIAIEQQEYWNNARPNEIVICLGVSGSELKWNHIFCTNNDRFRILLGEKIAQEKEFSPEKIVDLSLKACYDKFVGPETISEVLVAKDKTFKYLIFGSLIVMINAVFFILVDRRAAYEYKKEK